MKLPSWRSALALVPLIPALCTLRRFRNEFVYDDVFVIRDGSVIHNFRRIVDAFTAHAMVVSSANESVGVPAVDTYRPVALATLFFDALWSKRDPFGYHLTNLLLHIGVVVLLQAFARKLYGPGSEVRAALTALAFGLMPMAAEAHVWIDGRSDPLAALFGLAGGLFVLASFRATHRPTLALAGVFLCAVLGALSKETLLLGLPWLAALPERNASRHRRFAVLGTLLSAVASTLVLRAVVLHGLRTHDSGTQVWSALEGVPLLAFDTVRSVLLPLPYHLRNLRDDYAVWPLWSRIAALLLLIAGVAALRWYRRAPHAAWGAVWAALTIAPVAIVATMLWPGFGRYLYLPAIGLWLAAGEFVGLALARWPSFGRVSRVAIGAHLACSSLLLILATETFRSDRTLYLDAIEYAPEHAYAYGFLGLSLRRNGQCPAALEPLTTAVRLAPNEPRYAAGLGNCFLALGDLERADRAAREGLRRFRNERSGAGFYWLLWRANPGADPARRARWLDRCLELFPGRPDCAEARRNVPP